MDAVTVCEAAALSLDLEPRRHGPNDRYFFPDDQTFNKFGMRCRIIEEGDWHAMGRSEYRVSLPAFAAWAVAKGMDIPAELRALAGASPESEQTTVRDDGHDDELASLFDPVRVEQLEAMFPDGGKWANYAGRAHRNGLKAARVGPGQFNPYLAACWWLTQGPGGWDLARCLRKLANNLPARSKDSKPLLTGEYD